MEQVYMVCVVVGVVGVVVIVALVCLFGHSFKGEARGVKIETRPKK